MDKKEAIKLARSYKKLITPYFPENRTYLFGSYSKGQQTENSDIDICIILKDEITAKERIEIRTELLKKLIDLIDFEVDMFICSIGEWGKNHKKMSTFIGKISKEGEVVYG